MTSIAVIGGGKIGEALISGLVASGIDVDDITVSNRRDERSRELHEKYGVTTTSDNAAAVVGADVAFVCVKPKGIIAMLDEISDALNNSGRRTTVVSMAAGISLAAMEDTVPAETPVIRVMPNTPMLVRQGMCALAAGQHVTEEQVETTSELLRAVGAVRVVAESDMDAVTALSGSAPAYFYLATEALIDAGVNQGLTRDAAEEFAISSINGAAAMLKESGDDPATLRANVSSPAGTTVAALRELEESGLRGAFFRAAEACAVRSAELGAPAVGK